MYKRQGLLKGERQKSANIVGQTMKLNPHGDAAIYETMVRLATGNEALLAPFVESKGNFGKYYSGDLTYAASRYTEAKLSPICAEIFKDIDKDPVDFVDSYDGAMKEPRLLPTTFPNILVSANKGIGVAMASDICGFNLNEVCTATMHFLEDPSCDLLEYMPMPDFSTGGEIIYRREEMERIIETGLGSFQIRSRWRWVPEERIIEVYEIPYTTKTDVIIDRIVKLSKEGKVREIADTVSYTHLLLHAEDRVAADLVDVCMEQLVVELSEFVRARSQAAGEHAREGRIGEQPASEHHMTGPRVRFRERIHVPRAKDVAVVGHREGRALERFAIRLPARFALVAVLLHTRMHDEFRERQGAIQLEDAPVLGVVLESKARLDRDGQGRALAHVAQERLERVRVAQEAGALAL